VLGSADGTTGGVLAGLTGDGSLVSGLLGDNGVVGGLLGGNTGLLSGITGEQGIVGGLLGGQGLLGGLLGGTAAPHFVASSAGSALQPVATAISSLSSGDAHSVLPQDLLHHQAA